MLCVPRVNSSKYGQIFALSRLSPFILNRCIDIVETLKLETDTLLLVTATNYTLDGGHDRIFCHRRLMGTLKSFWSVGANLLGFP